MVRRKFVLLALVLCSAIAFTQNRPDASSQIAYVRSHYTKFEYRIPMRDGAKLFTIVYAPKDSSKQWPIMMQRTPYSVAPYGVDNYSAVLGPSDLFTKEGFIFVYQDVRGRNMSEGTFIDMAPHKTRFSGPRDADETTDTWDTVEWLVKNIPNNNGKVGQWGISYPGFYAAFALMDAHPAMKAVSPQAPMADVGNGDDSYHNGAYHLAADFGFYTSFKPRSNGPEIPQRWDRFDYGTPDAYDFFLRMGPISNANALYLKNQSPYWNDIIKHDTYDEFWQSRAQGPHMKNVKPAALFVGGWFDAEDLAGPLRLYYALEENGPIAPDTLVMGPWPHGGWARGEGQTLGDLDFASKTGEFYREQIEFPFFMQHLKGKASAPEMPKAWLFQTGTNHWRRFETWPPKNAADRALYLDARGKLTFSSPAETGFDEYVSDPARPVPVLAGIGPGMPHDYLTYDQRFASRRPDVLAYETEPLERDITVAGPITPVLKVSTSGADSDFVVKLIDVYPGNYPNPQPNPARVQMGGYQQLVRAEPFRGKFRNSRSKPEPFVPGQPAKIEFAMPDILHTFRAGHRIMVQIQSSWFPLIDRNPQTFCTIPNAKESDFQKATERVYRGGPDGTRVRVRVVE